MGNIDVTALGELLVDFTENGISANGNPLLEVNPGGAPCNMLAMLAKLGRKTAFIGKVGADHLGKMLAQTVRDAGIDTRALHMDANVHTTLAFVHTMEGGEREFSFCRNPGADMMLTEDEVEADLIRRSRLFHFGSLSMTHETVRSATKKALDVAKEAGIHISFDPNLRPPLWNDLSLAKEQIDYGMHFCDVLKIADNELTWFTGLDDPIAAAKKIQRQYKIPLVLATLGRDGSYAITANDNVYCPGFMVNTIETTGAGDTFFGCALEDLLQNGFEDLSEARLFALLRRANAAAALITTRRGALKVMPTMDEIEKLMRNS